MDAVCAPTIRERTKTAAATEWGDSASRAIRAGALSCVMGATAAVVIAQDGSEDACPRAALRQMMSVAVRHDAIADVAALELEVLRMCVERQELIREIVEGDRKLAGFRGSSTGATPVPAALTGTPVVELPPPAKVSAPAPEEPPPEQWEVREEAPVAEPVPVVGRARLSWVTVHGSAGQWVAGVSDGAKVWYVRAGDVLPSGVKVVSVRVRPPGVAVRHDGEQWLIPGPDGG